jgi:hypothetical protein
MITELSRLSQYETEIANRYVMPEDQPTSRTSRRCQTSYLVKVEETSYLKTGRMLFVFDDR